MTEGREREGGDRAQPAGKVVRLPRDWLGPREELVPFGRGETSSEAEQGTPALSSDSPPSAEDFWGERSAAIHDPVQAPAASVDVASRSGAAAATPPRRWLAAAAGLAIAVVAVVLVASRGFGLGGSAPRATGGPRVDMAAVLSGDVSRMVQRGIALVDRSAAGSGAAADVGHRARSARRIPHLRRVFRPVHETPHHPASPTPAVSIDVSREAPATVVTRQPIITPSTRRSSPPAASHPSSSSGATVSPTGESGALGPIHSPNG